MLSIGKIAKASGCKVQSIRYYEQMGLISVAQRTEGNQRLYHHSDISRLQFIRHARSMGFTIEMIKTLLLLENQQEHPCAEINEITKEHIDSLKNKIVRLQDTVDQLEKTLEQCSKKNMANCAILQTLHEHTHCTEHFPLNI